LQEKKTSQSDNELDGDTPLTDKLISDYFRVCRELGKDFNGLEMASFAAMIKNTHTVEHILEICEMIKKFDSINKMEPK